MRWTYVRCCLFIESTSSPLDYFPFNNIYLNIYLKEEFIFDSLVWTRHQMMLGLHIRRRRQLLNLAMVYDRQIFNWRFGEQEAILFTIIKHSSHSVRCQGHKNSSKTGPVNIAPCISMTLTLKSFSQVFKNAFERTIMHMKGVKWLGPRAQKVNSIKGKK